MQKDKQVILKTILNNIKNAFDSVSDENQNQLVLKSNPTEKFECFPLSDIQESFIVGRHFNSKEDPTGCHIYLEFNENNLDIERLKTAWKVLIEYHDILHTQILSNGTQQVMKEIPDYEFTLYKQNHTSPEKITDHLEAVRNKLSHRVYQENEWPLFEIAVSQLPQEQSIIHFSIDELIVDAFSMTLLLRQWYQLYRDSEFKLPKLDITFRDYILAAKEYEKTPKYQRDLSYWVDKLTFLSENKLKQEIIDAERTDSGTPQIKKAVRKRLEGALNTQQWDVLKTMSTDSGISPTALLLTLFSEIIATLNTEERFPIILTVYNRLPLHRHVDNLMGPFISTSIFVRENTPECSLKETGQNVQKQLFADLDHSGVSGIGALRELKTKHGLEHSMSIPYVFTSAVNLDHFSPDEKRESWSDKVSFSVTQTPQVYLDHQITEKEGKLVFSWDVVEDFFPPGLIKTAFSNYCEALKRLCEKQEAWDLSTLKSTIYQPENNSIPSNASTPDSPNQLDEFVLQTDPENPHTPFSLTDQQQAYLIGRTDYLSGGQVGCVAYQEFETTDLDVNRLNQAWQHLISIHDMLRVTIKSSGLQQIIESPQAYEYPIKTYDLTELSNESITSELEKIRSRIKNRLFPLDQWPFFELSVSQLKAGEYRIHFAIDLLIADAGSINLLLNQLFLKYEHPQTPLLTPALSFQAYRRSMDQFKRTPGYKQIEGYWERKFQEIPSGPRLPVRTNTNRTQTPTQARLEAVLPNWKGLRAKADQYAVSPSMILLAAYCEVISYWTNHEPFTIVIPSWDRLAIHPDIDRIVGDFTALCWVTSANPTLSFQEKINHYHEIVQKDLAHCLVSGLTGLRKTARRDPEGNMLSFPFVFTNLVKQADSPYSDKFQPIMGSSSTPQVQVDNISAEMGDRLQLHWDVIQETFVENLIEEMFAGYQRLLDALSNDPDQWNRSNFEEFLKSDRLNPRLIGSKEKTQAVPTEWNDTDKRYPSDQCLHHYIEQQVQRTPAHIAVCYDDQTLSYQQLNERANRMAHYLRNKGLVPDQALGVMMERSVEMVVALLAVLKAGGAYLPLDPSYPPERLEFIVNDASVAMVLTQQKFQPVLNRFSGEHFCLDTQWDRLTDEPTSNPTVTSRPDNLAYIIYTSGSTGQPKGCMVPHKAICNRLFWMQDKYNITDSDNVLQKTPFTFDVSVWEFFWPLLTGARLEMAQPGGHQDSRYLMNFITERNITVCHFVPSMLNFFLNELSTGGCPSLKQVFTSGEALSGQTVERFQQTLSATLHNLYGPTEAAVDVSYWECEKRSDKIVPIGRPIANIRLYILDDALQPVDIGVEGELHIGGIGLAKGYLNRPELTQAAFIPNPFGPDRLYKTGDKARYLPDGNIEYLGRIDFQVKVRGNRIELQEIEAVLLEHPNIMEVIVLVKDDPSDDPKLVAYLVTDKDSLTLKEIRDFAASKLPDYMLPNRIAPVDRMPVTLHGKLDRKALPWPLTAETKPHKHDQTNHSNRYADILDSVRSYLREVLDLKEINGDDDLFDLGATSFTIVQLAQRLSDEDQVTIPIDAFLDSPTLQTIETYIREAVNDGLAAETDHPAGEPTGRTVNGPPPEAAVEETAWDPSINPLQPIPLRSGGYESLANDPDFGDESLSFEQFSRFLSLLKEQTVGDESKYLYPTAGGLNAVQTYVYVKEGAVESVNEGLYYHHPIRHTLHRIHDKPGIKADIYHKYHRTAFEQAGFSLFFLGRLEAVQPVYGGMSDVLAALDTGYMIQLLMSRHPEFGLELCSVVGIDFESVRQDFKLNESDIFIGGMLGGTARKKGSAPKADPRPDLAGYLQNTGTTLTAHYKTECTDSSYMLGDYAKKPGDVKFMLKETQDAFKAAKHQLRRDIETDEAITLTHIVFPDADYLLRSSQRDYPQKTITRNQLSGFLSLLKSEPIDGNSKTLYLPVGGLQAIQAYLYIKKDRVEGLSEGVYQYDPSTHRLILKSDTLKSKIKPSYTPFNRFHYQKSAFCLFLIADLDVLTSVFGSEAVKMAALEGGCMGQLLMDHQSEFNMGICPIGGMRFDRIRENFKLDKNQELLHSFTCGFFEHPALPHKREFLSVLTEDSSKSSQTLQPQGDKGDVSKRSIVDQDMAIIGLSGRYPGAETLNEFWANLKAGQCSIAELPEERRANWQSCDPGYHQKPEGLPKGGFLRSIDRFDSLLFNISPMEARSLDPQERLFLETVWECLENAGYTGESLNQRFGRVGVFVGAMWSDYTIAGMKNRRQTLSTETMSFHSAIANRVSHFFNFQGPSLAVDTSCSSALTAIHMACESIKRGECDMAVAGGVNIIAHPYHQNLLSELDLTSKNDKSHAFGADADGWVAGEGVGAILIVPKQTAEENGAGIHGLIKGSLIRHIGRSVRYGSPNTKAWTHSIRDTFEQCGIKPGSIRHIEAAAPGAGIADSSEVTSLVDVFNDHVKPGDSCTIASIKPNIGHLESASVMSQLTKVLFQIKDKKTAPSINCHPTNPLIRFKDTPFTLVKQLGDGEPSLDPPNDGKPLRALINAFGATGSAGHLVIEEYIDNRQCKKPSVHPNLILLSAVTQEQVIQLASRLLDYLNAPDQPDPDVSPIGFTLRVGREAMTERLAINGTDRNDLKAKLNRVITGNRQGDGIIFGTADMTLKHKELTDSEDTMTVARQWTQGFTIRWSDADETGIKRIPLPTYPFLQERHWVMASGDDQIGTETAVGPQGDSTEPMADSAGIDSGVLFKKTTAYLKGLFSTVSEIPVSKIGDENLFENFGISSIMITQLNTLLEKAFRNLSKTVFFEVKNMRELADYFIREHSKELVNVLNLELPEKTDGNFRGALPESSAQNRLTEPVRGLPVGISTDGEREKIAIIGLSGRYPKAKTIQEFWNNLKEGRDCIDEVPPKYWDVREYFDSDPKNNKGKIYCKWGGFIDDVEMFDPLFFNISPLQAEMMDPQSRLFLEIAWEVIEDGGYGRDTLKRSYNGNVGVFVGVMYGEYQLYSMNEPDHGSMHLLDSSYGSIANRVSYFMDFSGPSLAVDTMCSSSLTALHLAVESIRRGECYLAVAGGVNLSIHPNKYLVQSAINMSSTDGRCRSFGAGGDGIVPGEGVGAVLLKPLSSAIEDNDRIYGLIRGASVNHGGRTSGYTVPNPNAQAELITEALQRSDTDPRMISYVEAHGTGTSLGDPIEIRGLSKAFGQFTQDKQYCSIGSVKSNIGHLESAAGIAGITKILLQIKHKKLVPSIHSDELNPNIDFSNSPFRIQHEFTDWKQPTPDAEGSPPLSPRIAAISSFGAGGANAHVIIEEYISDRETRSELIVTPENPVVIILSAKSNDGLTKQVEGLLTAVTDNDFQTCDLPDMAYTLQVGREAMEERLGLIVSSLKELKEKLEGFVEGNHDIADLYRGRVKRNQDGISMLTADEDMQYTIDAWITKGKHANLLELWVKGFAFDWAKLYGKIKPKRISLPTYPFAKKRYWIPETHHQKIGANAGSALATLHPLLHQNTSDLTEQRFSSTFSGLEFFLNDHRVNGQKVLPGVCYLEMAGAAVKKAVRRQTEGTSLQLKNVVWSQPITVNSHAKEVHIALFEETTGRIQYEIYTDTEQDEEVVVHSQGVAEFKVNGEVTAHDMNDLRSQMTQGTLSAETCYQTFDTLGLTYGSGHRAIREIYQGDDQILADLTLPASIQNTFGEYVLHPSLMDAALQSSIGLWLDSTSSSEPGSTHRPKPGIPFALESLDIVGPLSQEMLAWVRYAKGSHSKSKVRKLDVDLCDPQGNVGVKMRGFSSRVLDKESTPHKVNQTVKMGSLLTTPVLKETPTATDAAQQEYAEHRVILCDVEGVTASELNSLVSGSLCLEWGSNEQRLESRFTEYAVRCFETIQEILKQKPQGKVLIQIVTPDSGDRSLFAGLSGLLKTARLENPNVVGQLIRSDGPENNQSLAKKLKENSNTPHETDITYVREKRFISTFKESNDPKETPEIVFKENGVYLITGGLGALGVIFAKEILKQTREATIILTGRSGLTAQKETLLKELQSQGRRVTYRKTDISKPEQVTSLIESIQNDTGTLAGIIHGAGIILDNFMVTKTSADFKRVLAPKVNGAMNLDNATHDLTLDFFVLFSSIVGAMGNIGQADYAAANAFMDHFAAYRNDLVASNQRTGQTLSLNWPLWKEGGMTVDAATEEMMTSSTGMTPLETEAGIEAFYQGLALQQGQLMVMAGDLRKIRKLACSETKSTLAPERIPKAVTEETVVDHDHLLDKLQRKLVQKVSTMLKLCAEDIDLDVELSEFGFDSITLTGFTNQLNEQYALELAPTLFFEYPTLGELARYLSEEYANLLASHFNSGGKPSVAKPVETIDVEEPERSVPTKRRSGFSARTPVSQPSVASQDAVAVIGMSGTFPMAADIEAFWENLKEGKNCITEIPSDRWDWKAFYGDPHQETNKTNVKWGGFIEGIGDFDPLFFGIAPREAEMMDPQQRILLMYIWKAVEDAGITMKDLSQKNTGVFISAGLNEYERIIPFSANDPFAFTGLAPSSIPGRISHTLNLSGPSEYYDTACSSFLVALHRAIASIHAAECEYAVIGSVNLLLSPTGFIHFDAMGQLSRTGKAKSFQANADGYVRSEGAGAIIIKPLPKAIQDNNHIEAVIQGTGVSHGGKGISPVAPSIKGMKAAIHQAYRTSEIDPGTVSYVDAHGTATQMGDAIEIEALKSAYEEISPTHPPDLSQMPPCYISSLKPCIGHTEIASGLAAVIKVIKALQNKQIPGIPGFETLSDNISFQGSRFRITGENLPWEPLIDNNDQEIPRRAAINSYGIGGVNAHVIIEEYDDVEPRSPQYPSENVTEMSRISPVEPHIFVLSAQNENRLVEYAKKMDEFLSLSASTSRDPIDMAAIVYTLQVGREAMDSRLAIVVNNPEDLLTGLKEYVKRADGQWSGEFSSPVFTGKVKGHPEIMDLFLEREGKVILQTVLEERNLEKIAKYWVRGFDIPWASLYDEKTARRVSLPTYPFDKKRYWIANTDQSAPSHPAHRPAIVPDDTAGDKLLDAFDHNTVNDLSFKQIIGRCLKHLLSTTLGVDEHEIDNELPLKRLGFNSIMATQIKFQLESDLTTEIPIHILGSNNNISNIIDDIYDTMRTSHQFE